jgi:UDP-N-acetylmuramate dehydrogenase
MLEKELSGVEKNVLLKNYTTYKIGGPAKYFFVAENKEELIKAVKIAKKLNIPFFIFGGGSNLLISDLGYDGLVIKINISDIVFDKNIVSVGAGVSLSDVVSKATEKNLSGLEWVVGIPGATIGGAIFGHAQAFRKKISDNIESVQALVLDNLEIKNFSKEDCHFSLKNSIFKENKNFIIISAVLKFQEKNPEEIKNRIKENLDYRKNNHPTDFPSAGSTFVNPEIIIEDKDLILKFPELSEYNKNKLIPAGYLISKCGLSGKKIGDAQISEKHANFILNMGNAKAEDVLSLINLAKKEVKKTFGIELETEVQFLGF